MRAAGPAWRRQRGLAAPTTLLLPVLGHPRPRPRPRAKADHLAQWDHFRCPTGSYLAGGRVVQCERGSLEVIDRRAAVEAKLRRRAPKEIRPALVTLCGSVHVSIDEAGERFFAEQRRKTSTTPKSYLELIALYKVRVRMNLSLRPSSRRGAARRKVTSPRAAQPEHGAAPPGGPREQGRRGPALRVLEVEARGVRRRVVHAVHVRQAAA